VLFLGSLDWRPNQDGVALLLDRIFPAVIAQEPAARLTIVGRKPPEWMIRRVRECSSVELCADVPDVRPFLSECGLLAVPLRIGGGSRLKILEGLACECPVIATRVGAEGLELQPGRHFVEAEIDAMATAIVRQIRDPEPIRAMARAGRRVVANRYGWAGLANRLEKIWIREAVGR
jgi:glycosyltransferase involved in cell wall biosynthesis